MQTLTSWPEVAISAARRMRTQNEHIVAGLSRALAGVDWLVQRGYTILGIGIVDSSPAIHIQNCAACAHLHGVWCHIRSDQAERLYTMVTIIEGCRVEWTQRGH